MVALWQSLMREQARKALREWLDHCCQSHPNIIGYRGFNKKKDGMHALVMEDGHRALLDIIDVSI